MTDFTDLPRPPQEETNQQLESWQRWLAEKITWTKESGQTVKEKVLVFGGMIGDTMLSVGEIAQSYAALGGIDTDNQAILATNTRLETFGKHYLTSWKHQLYASVALLAVFGPETSALANTARLTHIGSEVFRQKQDLDKKIQESGGTQTIAETAASAVTGSFNWDEALVAMPVFIREIIKPSLDDPDVHAQLDQVAAAMESLAPEDRHKLANWLTDNEGDEVSREEVAGIIIDFLNSYLKEPTEAS